MGRMFEKRKHKMFARYDKMAKNFTRIGKEIAIAVKQGGALPENNPRLRAAMQNAKGVNMPKDRVENAIKRASSKDDKGYEEVTYEGYGAHGVAVIVECATDNTTRTVANVRMHFNRNNGALGTNGSVQFMFERMGVFKLDPKSVNIDELELDLIDAGAEDIEIEESEITVYCKFGEYGAMLKFFENQKIEPISSELQFVPSTTKDDLTDEQIEEVLELVEALEGDDDVQKVYHTLA
ncbi:MAG: YebC/PmpR family DNA-binding transcriptional regulator [Saprospiraceae bacterium]|jgi:YebC/PmpR family DNA-binding regulatory protein|nr:YebC/PmpR family DNA-binding transcriptional regulator [Saprospiraceae bacterium]